MERVAVDDVAPDDSGDAADRCSLTDPLGTTDVAVNHYRLAPGGRASGLHAHLDQEEVFVVVEGEATFETTSGEVVVGAGEAIRFDPGEHHSGPIADDGAVAAYAVGAPRDTEEVRIPLPCSECDHGDRRPGTAENGQTPVLVCPDCGATEDATCPACGGFEMRAVPADDGEKPVGVCQDCGAVAEP